ncbi:MAG: DUF4080 domain-containing protein, partial [Tepidisphaeraceae bacterium]
YEVLQTRELDFATMQRLRRFSRYWDLIANSGNFVETTPLLWAGEGASPFGSFLDLSDWLNATAGRTHGIALQELARLLFTYLTDVKGQRPQAVADPIWRDYQRGGRSDLPAFLRPYVAAADTRVVRPATSTGPARQQRHLAR